MILGRPVLGDAAGNAGVKLLQEALRRLAFNTQTSSADPAAYDGVLNLGTVIALANAAPVIGTQLHPTVGAALNVVSLIRTPIELIPYADSVLDVVLSPWIIDDVYSVILSILRLFPGGGSAASAIDAAVQTVKTALTSASVPLAAAIRAVTPNATAAPASAPPTLGEERAGFTWVAATPTVAAHWERVRVGQTPVPAPDGSSGPTVRDHRGTSTVYVPSPPQTSFPEGFVNSGVIVRDHRPWPKGQLIKPEDWNGLTIYEGHAALDDLNRSDAVYWRNATQEGVRNSGNVASGRDPFKVFFSAKNGTRMGAFYNGATQTLKIVRVPKRPSPKGHWYDFFEDGVDAVVAAASDVADAVEAAWDWVAENAADVYEAVKKYGCLIVNNDIVVAAAAGVAGIVATPASSAAVVAAAGSGRAACTALAIGEAVYAIIKFLATDFPAPPPLTTPTPPPPRSPKQGIIDEIRNQYVPRDYSIHVVMTQPPSVYPKGCVTRFNTTRQLWSVYCPVDTQLGGTMLAINELSPITSTSTSTPSKTPAPFLTARDLVPTISTTQPIKTATVSTLPPMLPSSPDAPMQCPSGTIPDANNQCIVPPTMPWAPEPIYKQPMFWIAVVGGVAVIGTGSYFVFRRKPVATVAGRRRRRR